MVWKIVNRVLYTIKNGKGILFVIKYDKGVLYALEYEKMGSYMVKNTVKIRLISEEDIICYKIW